ncbi:MAG TPA: hypothetical protein PKY82_25175 [Pyrinomonadaceae bacterium]|nr:hypothetical protein [Pyrinomonadaceae bacterium]
MIKELLIYVSLKTYDHPNTLSWIPVKAIHRHEDCYQIIEENHDPEHCYPQFDFRDVVRCVINKFAENEFGLIAVEKCNH